MTNKSKIAATIIALAVIGIIIASANSERGDSMKELKVSSSAFAHNGYIPAKYACDGENVSPPLLIEGIPENAESLVLIMDDPDAPVGTWDHWILINIPVNHDRTAVSIRENAAPGTQVLNSFGRHEYGGPCPPSGTHRYFFKAYALDEELKVNPDSGKRGVEKAMEGHIVAKGEMIGLYKRG